MSIITCKECKGSVSTTAKTCPHCGAKVPKKIGVFGWLFIIFIVLPFTWAVALAIFDSPTSTAQSPSATLATPTAIVEPPKPQPVRQTPEEQAAQKPEKAAEPPKATQPVKEPETRKGQWVKHEIVDAMTETKGYILSLRSENPTAFEFPYNQYGGSYLTLNFRKKGKKLDAYFVIDKGQMLCHSDCGFSLRVGDGKVQSWTGLGTDTHESEVMFVYDARDLEAIIKKGKPIRVGIKFYQSGTRAFNFEVDGYPGF